jgi:hypothetical protein
MNERELKAHRNFLIICHMKLYYMYEIEVLTAVNTDQHFGESCWFHLQKTIVFKLQYTFPLYLSWDSSDSIVTCYRQGSWDFSPHLLWGPPSLIPNRYQGLFPMGAKRPEREADRSSQSSAEVKNNVVYLHYTIHLYGMVLK